MTILGRLLALSLSVFLGAGLLLAAQDPAGSSCGEREPRWTRPKPAHTEIGPDVERSVVVVKFKQPSKVRLRAGQLVDLEGRARLSELQLFLRDYPGIEIRRLFTRPEKELEAERLEGERRTCKELGDLNLYYRFDLRDVAYVDPEAFVDALNAMPFVEIAYPPAIPHPARPPLGSREIGCGSGPGSPVHPAQGSPGDYEPQQLYLDPAPTGIDAEWAWGLIGGQGENVDYIDIEYNWNLNHDDLPSPFVLLPGTYTSPGPMGCIFNSCAFDNGYNQHGTAILGIVSGLDDGVGTTGIATDARFGVCTAGFDGGTLPDIANAIDGASSHLGVGDILLIELQMRGPYTGETCPCPPDLCGQFEMIPMEYEQANFDAIEAATVAGRIVVEVAGNGSMNLDNPIYGGVFDPGVRDSGAIMVTGGDAASHGALCFSNYGMRIDLQAYGNGIHAPGYGEEFPGLPYSCNSAGDCSTHYDELYHNDFGGSSGAGAIVTGAAAALQGVYRTNYGFTLWPGEVRDILKIHATPQPLPYIKRIGPMPNLRGAIRADLRLYQDPGWTYPLVPRSSGDATCLDVQLPATLVGNAPTTRLNSLAINDGVVAAPGLVTSFYVDDIEVETLAMVDVEPRHRPCLVNVPWVAPITVRGGRHTVRVAWDAADVVPEWDEDNNHEARQFVWSPLVLGDHAPVTRPAPPDRDTTGHVDFNCDGYEITVTGDGSMWGGVGVLPVQAADDFDLRLHDDYAGSEVGFSDYTVQSAWSAGLSDFVLVNGLEVGLPATRWVGAVQGADTPDTGDMVVEYAAGPKLVGVGTFGPYTLGPNQVLEVVEIIFGTQLYGRHLDFELENLGAADLGFSLYSPALDYAAKSDHVAGGFADSTGPGGDEQFTALVESPSFYALAIWKYSSADLPLSSDYNLIIRETPPNLEPTRPEFWLDPVVARGATGCSGIACDVTPTLPGNVPLTRVNFHASNTGINPVDASLRNTYLIDDVPLTSVDLSGTWYPGDDFFDVDNGPFEIKGGRHTLGILVDALDAVEETNEDDNAAFRQFVWSPYEMAEGISTIWPAPPDRDSAGAVFHNCDGFSHATGWWSAVALTPTSPGVNFDLRLHDDYAGSQTGFAEPIRASHEGSDRTDVVLVNANHPDVGFGSTWYPAVIQASDVPQPSDYIIQYENATLGHGAPGLLGPFSIPAYGLLGVHEVHFSADTVGGSFGVRLLNDAGEADLGIALYDDDLPHAAKADLLAGADQGGWAEDETFWITIEDEGYYGLLVWKHDSADLPRSSDYRVEIQHSLPFRIEHNSLRLGKTDDPDLVDLSWGPDCNTPPTVDYSIYAGDLLRLRTTGIYDYNGMTPVCRAGADMAEAVPLPPGDVFFLVVPHDGTGEGSYGQDSAWTERPPAAPPVQCHPQNAGDHCLF
jgi:hypothetical protein